VGNEWKFWNEIIKRQREQLEKKTGDEGMS
jgi:hypothetical protein